LEAREGEFYHADDDEWAAIEEGFQEAERGEFASDEEVAGILAPRPR
jgi:predicted transcriptional regulator